MPAPSPAAAGLILTLALLGAGACGSRDREVETEAHAPDRTEDARPSSEATGVGAPGVREPSREDTGAGTPRRAASERLVEEGKGYWISGRDADARARLQEALRLDGSNGAAYYYLAALSADAREWSDAEGYLEQAQTLLGGREDYRAPLSDLAERIAARR